MKARRMMLGIGLLALAGGIVGRKLGIIPDLPIGKMILCGIAGVLAVDGIRHKNFFLMLLPLAFIAHIASNYLGIFTGFGFAGTMGVAALAAAGLTFICGSGNRKSIGSRSNGGYINDWSPNGGQGGQGGQGGGQGGQGGKGELPGFLRGEVGPVKEEGSVQENFGTPTDDGEDIVISNSFGKLTRYLHSSNLKRVKIDNGFGNCIVYYDNVYVDENGSRLEIGNGFGQVNVYIPPFYRFRMKQDNGFGSINVFGNCSMDPNAPLIDAKIDNGMGKVNIYFG